MASDPFFQTALILGLSVALGGLGLWLRQPLIVTFIGVGILCGPDLLGIVEGGEILELLAELGIALLLFVVGLKLDLHMIRTMGPVALATGLGQVFFTSTIGFFLVLLLGFAWLPALYIAVALTFSSTIIIVKLLTDKKEIDALHGRIAIGFLIVQDILVVVALIFLSSFGAAGDADGALWLRIGQVLLYGTLFLAAILLLMRWVIPPVMQRIARNPELLVLFSVAWAVALAQAGAALGFSHEVGAFLGGMSLAATPFRETIGNRLTSLRDFLLLFFFIKLGSTLELGLLGAQVGPAILLSLFVLIGNPLIVMTIMGVMGYRKRTGFLAGLTVAQISEFSLVLAALGVSVGHLTPDGLGLVTLVGLITIALSTYLILYSFPLYAKIAPWLSIFERRVPYAETEKEDANTSQSYDVILFGMGRFGHQLSNLLLQRQRRVLTVDFDPAVVDDWRKRGHAAIYGDVDDPDLLEHVPLEKTKWVVVAMPFRQSTVPFVSTLRKAGYQGKVAVTVANEDQARECRQSGADLIFRPFADAAEQAVDGLTGTTETLTRDAPWPVSIREVRVPSGSSFSGKYLRDLSLRADTGASIVAVSRAGRSLFDLAADFQIFPGDRLVLAGDEEALEKARQTILQAPEEPTRGERPELSMDRLPISAKKEWIGHSIGSLDLRKSHGVTVVSVRRGEQLFNAPSPTLTLEKDDELFLLGRSEHVNRLCQPSLDV